MSFNEAEARTPRMPASAPNSTAIKPGQPFNEAEARTPRMLGRGEHAHPAAPGPSMRPRRERLGCDHAAPVVDREHRVPSMRPRRERLGCAVAMDIVTHGDAILQ